MPAVPLIPGLLRIGGTALRWVFSKKGLQALGWGALGAWGLSKAADSVIPTFEEEIIVRVEGNRLSTKKKLYFLALACAFGRVQNLSAISALPPAGMIAVDYDANGKSVQVTIKNQYSGISNIIKDNTDETSVFTNGPQEELIGGDWSYHSYTIGGTLPKPPEEMKEYVGARILTDKEKIEGVPVINPQLPHDDNTRGTYLEWLTSQALSFPCAEPAITKSVLLDMNTNQETSDNKPKKTPAPKKIPLKKDETDNKDVNQ